MRRFCLAILMIANLAFASDIKGIIEKIDTEQKTILVNGNIIKVMPYTEIEKDSCGLGWDSLKVFADLQVDDVVEVDVFYNEGQMIAKEIEIGCVRAY